MCKSALVLCALLFLNPAVPEAALVSNFDPEHLLREARQTIVEAVANGEVQSDEADPILEQIALLQFRMDMVVEAELTIQQIEDAYIRNVMRGPLIARHARMREMKHVIDLISRIREDDSGYSRLDAVRAAVEECMRRLDFVAALELVERFVAESDREELLLGIAKHLAYERDYEGAHSLSATLGAESKAAALTYLAWRAVEVGDLEVARKSIAEAIGSALMLNEQGDRNYALGQAVRVQVGLQDLRQAEQLVGKIDHAETKDIERGMIAVAYAARKEFDKVEKVLASISDQPTRLKWLSDVAVEYVLNGEAERAVVVCRRIRQEDRDASLLEIIWALASANETNLALACALQYAPEIRRDSYISEGVFMPLWEAGDYEGALRCIAFLSDWYDRTLFTLWIAEALHGPENRVRGLSGPELLQDADRLAQFIAPENRRALARAHIAKVQYSVGLAKSAERNIERALELLAEWQKAGDGEAELGVPGDDIGARLAKDKAAEGSLKHDDIRIAVARAYSAGGQGDKALEIVEDLSNKDIALSMKIGILTEALLYEEAYEVATAALEADKYDGTVVRVCRKAVEDGRLAWAIGKARVIEPASVRAEALYEIAEFLTDRMLEKKKVEAIAVHIHPPIPGYGSWFFSKEARQLMRASRWPQRRQ